MSPLAAAMNDEQLLRYSRHILLDEIGIEGQQRLIDATALDRRCRRPGVVRQRSTSRPPASVRILLADGDTVDLTNLQRQILHRADRIGHLQDRIGQAHPGRAESESRSSPCRSLAAARGRGARRAAVGARRSRPRLLRQLRHPARDQPLRASRSRVPLVCGAAIRFDGQLAVFDRRRPESPCYNCLFPEGDDVEEIRCSEMGVFAPLTGMIGTMQAAEALQILGGFGEPATGRLVMVDGLTLALSEVRVPRDPQCAVCGTHD